MASRIETAKAMATQSLHDIAASPEVWQSYLRFQGIHYKYGFADMLFAFAQRPEATALATFDEWNNPAIGRRIKYGSKGIALPLPGGGSRYVFDVADTQGRDHPALVPWKLTGEKEAAVCSALTETFSPPEGESFTETNLHSIIAEIADQAANQFNSGLQYEEYGDEPGFVQQADLFHSIVFLSAMYSIYDRCGFDTKDCYDETLYAAARATVTNAHYTSDTVINAMYDGVKQLGFKGGRVLEPSMGVGNFFGLMPDDLLQNSRLTGVELDSVTGRIAKQL